MKTWSELLHSYSINFCREPTGELQKLRLWFILGVIVLLGGLTLWWVLKPVSMQETVMKQCIEGLNDIHIAIRAVQEKNAELCATMTDADAAVFCRAEVNNDAHLCDKLGFELEIKYCKAIVNKEKDFCGANAECLAYVTEDVSYCEKLDVANANECKSVVLQDPSFLHEEDCNAVSEKFKIA